jgi:hypothetical protein
VHPGTKYQTKKTSTNWVESMHPPNNKVNRFCEVVFYN